MRWWVSGEGIEVRLETSSDAAENTSTVTNLYAINM